MSNQENRIIIGRFGRPHGIKGFVTVHSFTEPRDNILRYAHWNAYIDYEWQPIKLLGVEVYNKAIIALVEGYADRDMAGRLTNIEIAIPKEHLGELSSGEYYWHQLVGMNVINSKGESFGKVVEIIPTGSNDVLVVQGEKRHLIPYLPGQFVLDVDSSQQLITVDWDLDF